MTVNPIARLDQGRLDILGICAFQCIEQSGEELLQESSLFILCFGFQDGDGFGFGEGVVADNDILDQPGLRVVLPMRDGIGAINRGIRRYLGWSTGLIGGYGGSDFQWQGGGSGGCRSR